MCNTLCQKKHPRRYSLLAHVVCTSIIVVKRTKELSVLKAVDFDERGQQQFNIGINPQQ